MRETPKHRRILLVGAFFSVLTNLCASLHNASAQEQGVSSTGKLTTAVPIDSTNTSQVHQNSSAKLIEPTSDSVLESTQTQAHRSDDHPSNDQPSNDQEEPMPASKSENGLSTNIAGETMGEGEAVYRRLCANCHGDNGQPSEAILRLFTTPPTNLALGTLSYGDSLEEIQSSIANGLGENMFRFNNRLSEEQIKAVANYVLQLRSSAKASGL